MMRFAYTGRSAAGPVRGELEGASAVAVADALLARGVTPLTIEPDRADARPEARAEAPAWPPRWLQPRVKTTDLLLFSRQLHTLLRSGVPILRALAGLQDSATGERMRATLAEVRRSLESGIELSMSFAQHAAVFSPFYVAMVRVGEMTGRLDEVFMSLFRHLEFELYMQQQVKSALRYPAFVIAAMVAAVAVINLMVVPAFATVFRSFNAELPWATQLLIGASDFTLHHGAWLALAAAAGAFALKAWIDTPPGREAWDRWRLRVPLAGRIVKKATLARFARSFALALKSGVPVERALSVTAHTVDNRHIARKVEQMRDAVERGETILRAAAASGEFTPVVLQMLAVGEETGAVDELLDEVADLYSNDVQYELKTLAQQIEPVLIVVMGALVLVLALGVFLPMWDLGRVAFKR
ncbi:MAG: type II secretion system F family protein [Burkholderiaceae bacterium]